MAALSQAYVCLLLCLGMVVLCHAVRPMAHDAMTVPLGRMGEDNGLWYTPPMSPVASWHHGVPPHGGRGRGGSINDYSYPPYGGGGGGSINDYSYPPYGGGGGGGYSYPPYNGVGNGGNYGGCSGCEAPGRGCNCDCGCPPYDSWPEYSGNGLSAKGGINMKEKKDGEGGHSP